MTGALLGLLVDALACATEGNEADVVGDGDTGGLMLDADEQLCLDWCLSANASECPAPFGGELCYTRCMQDLGLAAGTTCEAERRDVLACEAGIHTRTEGACETLDCVTQYKREDLCRGYCVHLGGVPGSGGSQTDCEWRSSCYEHDFEARCPVGVAVAQCECYVDDELAGQCEQPGPIAAFECGGDLHVFTTCCGAIFEEVLLP